MPECLLVSSTETKLREKYNVLARAVGGRAITHSEILTEGGDYYEYIRRIKLNRKHCFTDRSNSESYT